jgi:acetyltransferase-like isoleucine patch superfamily enzyme
VLSMHHMFLDSLEDCVVEPNCLIGVKYRSDCRPVQLGKGAWIRSGTILYADVVTGENFHTGHHVLVREKTTVGSQVVIGTNTVIDGNVIIGDYVKIESNCYIPTHTRIGCRVFFGPNVTLTNDRYPLKMRHRYKAEGPVIEDGVTLCAGVIVVPGVTIGKGSFVAAGAVVTKDVPCMSLVKGVPGRVVTIPEHLREINMALSWRKYLDE